MTNQQEDFPNAPKPSDVVSGNLRIPITGDVVIGGLERLKQQYQYGSLENKIATLHEAMNYGEAGIKLVIEALENGQIEIKQFAYQLLKDVDEQPLVEQAIQKLEEHIATLTAKVEKLQEQSAQFSMAIAMGAASMDDEWFRTEMEQWFYEFDSARSELIELAAIMNFHLPPELR